MPQLDETFNGQSVTLRPGEVLDIALPEARTTGFQWHVREGAAQVSELEEESTEVPPGPPGRGGLHRWRFRATHPGEANILLHYRRPWEPDAAPGRVFQVQLRVSE